MKQEVKDSEEVQDSPFNGSLDTLSRINQLITDISSYRVNNHWLGMKENLGELLNEAQGCLSKAEYKKAWADWEKIEAQQIVINDDESISFDENLPVMLKRFSSWLRLKLYRHNLTMAKTSGGLDKLQMMYNRYGIK